MMLTSTYTPAQQPRSAKRRRMRKIEPVLQIVPDDEPVPPGFAEELTRLLRAWRALPRMGGQSLPAHGDLDPTMLPVALAPSLSLLQTTAYGTRPLQIGDRVRSLQERWPQDLHGPAGDAAQEAVIARLRLVLATGRPVVARYLGSAAGGEEAVFEALSCPLLADNGTVGWILTISRDAQSG